MSNVGVESLPSRWRRFWRTAFLMVEAMETTQGELLEERLENLAPNSSGCAKGAAGTVTSSPIGAVLSCHDLSSLAAYAEVDLADEFPARVRSDGTHRRAFEERHHAA